ncbi:transposase [Amycolatopsis sp. NPDC050768]|uniref:transposase n=1 Tax=Amycolatopsis sp. NPDC050768 TaxID=3154839 RepID=UPI00340897E2
MCGGWDVVVVSRFQLLSDEQWALIEGLLPLRTGRRGRPFSDARAMVEGILYRYRCGIAWRDVPEVFGPWQTIWTWHRRMAGDDTWEMVLQRLLTAADAAGQIGWAVSGFLDRAGESACHQRQACRGGLGRITRFR